MLHINQLIGFGAGGDVVIPTTNPASFIFNGTDELLTRTLSTSSPNDTILTVSFWLRTTGTDNFILNSIFDANNFFQVVGGSDKSIIFRNAVAGAYLIYESSNASSIITDDTWHHYLVVYDSTQAVTEDRIKMHVDGSIITDNTYAVVDLNEVHMMWKNGSVIEMGNITGLYQSKRLAFIDILEGVAAAPSDLAFDNGGTWTRKKFTGSYGTYGFRLDGSIGFNDGSGNGQHFSGTNMDPGNNLDSSDLPPYTN